MSKALFQHLFIVEMVYGALAFISLFFVVAPYGRHFKRGWGPSITARKAWVIQEFPAFVIILIVAAYYYQDISIVQVIFVLIWQLHYFHRTFIYPYRISNPYKPYPLILVIMAIVFNVINGLLNSFEIIVFNKYGIDWIYDPRFLIGLLLFIGGYVINKDSDRRLLSLRNGNSEYQIPTGGMFKYVTCPNYLGEMMGWLGWAIMTWSLAGLGFFIFTLCNLFPRALSNHKWYLEKFKDYPKNRKAIFPFLI